MLQALLPQRPLSRSVGKDRLYIALYAMEDIDDYHWALLVCPKEENDPEQRAMRYHATVRLTKPHDDGQRDDSTSVGKVTWIFEAKELSRTHTRYLQVRVLIAKVKKTRPELEASLKKIVIRQDVTNWDCQSWVQDAIDQLLKDDILKHGGMNWNEIEARCLEYVRLKKEEGKIEERLPNDDGGTSDLNTKDPRFIPTYDLIKMKEVIP